MKINIYNTKPCKVTFCNEDDGIYDAPHPFDNLNAALAYCKEEIDVRQQAISAAIWDIDTGEVYVVCGIDEEEDEDFGWDDGCPIDDVDESNYDPYAGCDMFEVEPFDFGGDF